MLNSFAIRMTAAVHRPMRSLFSLLSFISLLLFAVVDRENVRHNEGKHIVAWKGYSKSCEIEPNRSGAGSVKVNVYDQEQKQGNEKDE